MEVMFCGLTKRDICILGYQLAVRNNTLHPFKEEVAGKDCFYAFLNRNLKLSICKPIDISFTRAREFNKDEFGKF